MMRAIRHAMLLTRGTAGAIGGIDGAAVVVTVGTIVGGACWIVGYAAGVLGSTDAAIVGLTVGANVGKIVNDDDGVEDF